MWVTETKPPAGEDLPQPELGVVTQSMAEITLLAEAAGVSRADFLEFLNDSVMGSTFTTYKTPAFVNLDYTPTFTWHLLRKDFELGLETGRLLNVPLPTAALVHQIVMDGIGRGFGDQDFAAMLATPKERASISPRSKRGLRRSELRSAPQGRWVRGPS